MSRSLLAAPHSMCELRSLLCKTVITIADILLKPVPHVQTVLYTIACGLIFYYHARMVSASIGSAPCSTPGNAPATADSVVLAVSMPADIRCVVLQQRAC